MERLHRAMNADADGVGRNRDSDLEPDIGSESISAYPICICIRRPR